MHIPVLLQEVMEMLSPVSGDAILDCTLGLGGHAKTFLKLTGKKGTLTGLDADKENLEKARKRLQVFDGRCVLHHVNFREIASFDFKSASFDIIFADLGLSSPHIDEPERGFTFREDGPLDCRFDQTSGKSVAEFIADVSEEEITRVLREYGELKIAPKLARFFKKKLPKTTLQLKETVMNATEHGARSILPQVFQALRIAVNDEMGALEALLKDAPSLLKKGGRLGIISYHSLEDRMVKNAFKTLTSAEKHPLTGVEVSPAPFVALTKKPIRPSAEEVAENSRARSARFRVISMNRTL